MGTPHPMEGCGVAPVGCRPDGGLPDGHARGGEPGSAARALQRLRLRSAAPRGRGARERRLGNRPPARHRRARGLARRDRALRAGRAQRAASSARTTATATGSTRWSSIRPGTGAFGQAIEREIHSLPWRDPQPGGHAVRAALFFVWSQVNSGVMCPVSMTYSAIPALREEPDLAAEWEPRITRASYDDGALVGMAMTEKQGGSDVRANSTRAVQNGDAWEITGHKWFCSYPPCDLFLTLAQAPAGLTCFLIEGRDPGFRIQRLKDKLGTRSLPSSEVEFHGRARAARRRGGARRPDDHPDGQPHPARLPDRIGGRDALGRRAGRAPRAAPERVREAARRPAADAERAGRPGDRVGGGDRGDDARGARLRRGRRRRSGGSPPPS